MSGSLAGGWRAEVLASPAVASTPPEGRSNSPAKARRETAAFRVCSTISLANEEDYFATLEAVRNIMDEGKKLGAVDSFIGGDINIELKLEPGDEGWRGRDHIRKEAVVATAIERLRLHGHKYYLGECWRSWRMSRMACLGFSCPKETT